MQATHPSSAPGGRPRLAATSRRLGERAIIGTLALAAGISVLVTVGIVVALLVPSIEFFAEISPAEFFGTETWAPLFEPPAFGVIPLIVGTLSTTLWACLICLSFCRSEVCPPPKAGREDCGLAPWPLPESWKDTLRRPLGVSFE